MIHNRYVSNSKIYLTNTCKSIQNFGIHDTVQNINSSFKTKPWSDAEVRMQFRFVVHLCSVHGKEAWSYQQHNTDIILIHATTCWHTQKLHTQSRLPHDHYTLTLQYYSQTLIHTSTLASQTLTTKNLI